MTPTGSTQSVEMRVADVRRESAEADKPHRHVVVLEEIGGTRRLPIWIGSFEGEALAFALEKVQPPRPLAYTLTANLLRAAGGRLREVRVSRLVEDIFYAVAVVEGPGGTESVDARPSDALNLALIAGAPIRVEPAVLAAEETAQAADPERIQKMQTMLLGEGWEGAAEIAASLKAKQSGQGTAASEPR